MSNTVRVDQRAFNRGVEEVLTLKPIMRAAKLALARSTDKPNPQPKTGTGSAGRPNK